MTNYMKSPLMIFQTQLNINDLFKAVFIVMTHYCSGEKCIIALKKILQQKKAENPLGL